MLSKRRVMRGFFCGGLQQIAESGRYDVSLPELKRLLGQDRSVANARGRLGKLLHYAANHVDLSRPADGKAVAETLIRHGADVNVQSGAFGRLQCANDSP